ncbi:hypothetical protein MOQ_004923 [Trypanosoma cruzi marinkellei]|uniref:Uncharacterized protein n=1 Tax=Trypanosoma cruzi marinkellei TaxID=85056 RepID=K2M870_TRYCR|nr:hypothetical protein MOQ_004923 [Trypanosoma cruzi marinkellei]
MSIRMGRCANVYIALHPCVSSSSEELMNSTFLSDETTPEEGVGRVAHSSRMPCVILPSSIQVKGSGTHILFHNGCVDHRSIATTLGDAAWNELRRSGTFWCISCLPPHVSKEGESRALGELGSVEASMLECLSGRVLQVVSSPLRVSVIQWMEGGGNVLRGADADEPPWRYSKQSEGEFADVGALIEFVKGSLTENSEKTATFSFHLVSITFFDPECAGNCEIVIAGVGASFAALSVSASRSLVAVRAWFANVASACTENSQHQRHNNRPFFDLDTRASEILPEEIVRFLFARLLHFNREGEGDGHVNLQPTTQVVYAVLEVDVGALLQGEKGLHANDGASASLLRYVSFWSSLGAFVVKDYDDDDGGNADGHDRAAGNDTSGENHCAGTGRIADDILIDAKARLQKFLIDPLIFSRLTEGWCGREAIGDTIFSKGRILAALEQSHRVSNVARQKGLQRRLRRCLSSATHQSTSVSDVLAFFSAENEAVMWCQRLEWQYYIMLGDFFETVEPPSRSLLAPNHQKQQQRQQQNEALILFPEGEETFDNQRKPKPLLHEGSHKEAEGSLSEDMTGVKPHILSCACDGLGSARTPCCSRGAVPQSSLLVPPQNLFYRLSEAEVVRRLLIKLSAAESMKSILFCVAFQLRGSHVQEMHPCNGLLHAKKEADGARQSTSPVERCEAPIYLDLLREYTREIEDIFLPLLVESVEEKLGCFVELVAAAAAAARTKENKMGRIHFPPVDVVDAAVQTIIPPSERHSGVMDENSSGWEPCAPLRDEASHQQVLEEVTSSTESADVPERKGSSSRRRPSEDGDLPNMDENTANALHAPTVEGTAVEFNGDGKIILGDESQLLMPERGCVESPSVDCGRLNEEVTSEVSLQHVYRLCRVNARGSAQNSVYRRLLTTGRIKNVVNQRSESNGTLPALSFSEIMEEKARWCKSEDLDEYRKLLAYSIYVVGTAGCGKSSFISSLLHEASLSACLPAVEPHTMTIRRTSTIVEVPFPTYSLPLGGHSNIASSNMRQWMTAGEENHVEPSRVGVNFVEVPAPFLFAASTGHVKLPSRGVVYYILYRLQDDWKLMEEAIWQQVQTIQHAVTMPSLHVLNALRDENDSVGDPRVGLLYLPVVLVGTHRNPTVDLVSVEQPAAAQHQLDRLRLWFEERVGQQRESTEGQLPRPVLIDSCLTNTSDFLFISENFSNNTAFQTLLHRTLRFLHHTAPLSPLHILARWLPRSFFIPLEPRVEGVDEHELTDFNAVDMQYMIHGTLEGFWKFQRRRREFAASMQQQQEENEDGEANRISLSVPVSPHRLRLWWSCSSEGLLVLFTALQRLRQFVSCCFDEQSFDNAVLYHLGFVHPDDPDEIDVDDEKERCLRGRDVFLEALLEECRLRGALFFLPCTLFHSPEENGRGSDPHVFKKPPSFSATPNQQLRMVLLGPEWVENIWSQTLAPQMVVYHTISLLGGAGDVTDDVLSTIFFHCEKQLGVTFAAAHFTAVWSRLHPNLSKDSVESKTQNMDKISECLYQYLTRCCVSSELLQFLWRPPYNILATNETGAVMALIASGLARRETREEHQEPKGYRDGLTGLHLPCAPLTPGSLLYACRHEV